MDLQTLSRTTKEAPTSAVASQVPKPKRRWFTRVVLPTAIVVATLLLIAYASRDLILPARQVKVVRAVAINGVTTASTIEGSEPKSNVPASVVAQAPGWVEPDPYPTYVTALADGVVQDVLVLEGEVVKAGQPVVRLVKVDAELALVAAKAELARTRAALTAAETNFNEPIALERAEAVSRAGVAEAKARLIKLDAEVAREEARLAELVAAYERLRAMSDRSVSKLKVEAAKYQAQSHEAVLKATQQRRPELEASLQSAEAVHAAAKRDLELKVKPRQALDDAKSAVDAAQTRVDQADLRLERMTVKSPVDGVVMARLVSPGAKVMLGMDEPHSAHAVHLYNPSQLQVRVDVPIADAAAVGVGQQAIIIVDVLPNIEFEGVVTRLVHQADIAKNTVQFKVAIKDPSPLLKPDMLARVKFLGGAAAGVTTSNSPAISAGSTVVAIQRSALVQGGESAVWWISPTNSRLERRAIKLGSELAENRVIIREGLNPGDVIVNNPAADLGAGQRVHYQIHSAQPE